ncbi:MAG: HTTM domain-containing protein [Cyclobacteriaceae bacterium]|nr:HTTM domain-containing protein [Cyclobacteriaceae bacterium]
MALFRIGFGLLLFLEGVGAVLTGWVGRVFVAPNFNFSFISFHPWLQPLPGDGMYYYFIFMGICGLGIMLGYHYRIAATLYFFMWTSVYLMQKTSYNNHYYLMVLLTALFIFLPAHKYFSLDVKQGRTKEKLFVPQWTQLSFIWLMFIVYTYAAIAKIYPDWIQAKPVSLWFNYKKDYPIIGPLLAQEWYQYFVAYMGILFDGAIVPLLLWKKTRKYTVPAAFFFHLFNSFVFKIGIFPYMMLAMSVFFFEKDKVRAFFFRKRPIVSLDNVQQSLIHSDWQKSAIKFTWVVFFAFMVLLPLRHWLYPGNVHWTEEGHRLSWHMMLRSKSGNASFRVIKDGELEVHSPYKNPDITPKQASRIGTKPDMVWQYAQYLKRKYQAEGYEKVEVYADVKASLNGRPFQLLIDPEVDLATEKWYPFRPHSWIVPLKD